MFSEHSIDSDNLSSMVRSHSFVNQSFTDGIQVDFQYLAQEHLAAKKQSERSSLVYPVMSEPTQESNKIMSGEHGILRETILLAWNVMVFQKA